MSASLEALARAAEGREATPALVEDGCVLSYGALVAEIRAPFAIDPRRPVPIGAGLARDVLVAALRCRHAGGIPAIGGAPLPPSSQVMPPETAFLRSTSGTTGAPRWIAFSDEQAANAAGRSAAMMVLGPGDVVITTLSAATSFGWVAGLMGPLLAGATVVAAPASAPRAILDLAGAWGPSWIVTTPPVVAALARLLALEAGRASRLRILVGSSAYPTAAAQRLLDAGVRVVDRYGASEAGPIAQAPEPLEALRAGPGVAVSALDDRLVARSDSVAIGELGGARFGGVFQSADLVAFEPDGRFRLQGRADRVVRRAGRSISLGRLEALLRAVPGVDRAHVECRNGVLDVELVATVVPEPGATLAPDEILAQISEELQPFERPKRIELVDPAEPKR